MRINSRHAHEAECLSCGSTLADREAFGQRNMGTDRNLSECPHCGACKCCMCDLGDDVECPSCHTAEGV